MTPVTNETIEAAIQIIGRNEIEDEEIEREVRELVADDMTARRLIDWIPEAFGYVLVAHMEGKVVMPTTFMAKASDGKWRSIKFTREPIFVAALQIAQRVYHEGPRELFQNTSLRSSVVNAVSNLLNSGGSLDGACMSGPALIGIPAEVYPAPPSLWSRLFGR